MPKLVQLKDKDGPIYPVTRNLVAQVVLTSHQNIMEITGLDIIKDGGIYDIEIAEYGTTSSSSGHYLQVNGITTGYSGSHNYTWDRGSGWVVSTHTGCLAFANGWSMGTNLFYTSGTLQFFNKDWVGFDGVSFSANSDNSARVQVQQTTALALKNITNITSIRVIATSGGLIGSGSYMKIYKRG